MIAVTKSLLGGLETAVAPAAKKDGTTALFADTFQQVSAKQASQATKVVTQPLNKAVRSASGKKAAGVLVAANAAKSATGTEVVAAAPYADVFAGGATGVIRPTGGTDEQANATLPKKGADVAGVIEDEATPVAGKQTGDTPAANAALAGKVEVAQPKIASEGSNDAPASAPASALPSAPVSALPSAPVSALPSAPLRKGDQSQQAEVVGDHRPSTTLQAAGPVDHVSTAASAVSAVRGDEGESGSIIPTGFSLAPKAEQDAPKLDGRALQAGKGHASFDTVALVPTSGAPFDSVVTRPAADAGFTSLRRVTVGVAGATDVVGEAPTHRIASSAQGVNRLQSAKAGVATSDLTVAADTPDQGAHAQTEVSGVTTTAQGAKALVFVADQATLPPNKPIGDSNFVPANIPRERKAMWVEGPAYVASTDAGTAAIAAEGTEAGVNARVSSSTSKRSGLATEGPSKEADVGAVSNAAVSPSEVLPAATMTAALGVQTASMLSVSASVSHTAVSAKADESVASITSGQGVASQPAASKVVEGPAQAAASNAPEGALSQGTFAGAVSASTAGFDGVNLAPVENVAKDAVPAASSSSSKNGASREVAGGGTSVSKGRRETGAKSGVASDAANAVEPRPPVADAGSPAVTHHSSKTMPSEHQTTQSSEAQAAGGGIRSVEEPAPSSQAISMAAPVAPSVHAMPSSVKAEGSLAGMGSEIAASQAGVQSADPVLSPMAHTTLSATPTVLEVGVPGGTQGWLKIRAEIGEGGVVQASMSASTHAGQDALHRDLPAISAFLESEHVPVNLQIAHGTSASVASLLSGGDATKDTGFNQSSSMGQSLSQNPNSSAGSGNSETAARTSAGAGGGNGESDGQKRDGYERASGVSEAKAATRTGLAADWSTPAGYGSGSARGGGSWLNVIA